MPGPRVVGCSAHAGMLLQKEDGVARDAADPDSRNDRLKAAFQCYNPPSVAERRIES